MCADLFSNAMFSFVLVHLPANPNLKPLIFVSSGMRIICRPGFSHRSDGSVSHISHSPAMNPSGMTFLQSRALSFNTSTQKSCWTPFYMLSIMLFLLSKQLLLTPFTLEACLTRLFQRNAPFLQTEE